MQILTIGLAMDVLLLLCLACAVYYMVRLSRSLNTFKSYRQEFLQLVGELSQNIEKANLAIEGMKNASKISGETLQGLIDRARLSIDELRQVNAAADTLAGRLEGLAEKNGRLAQQKQAAPSPQRPMPPPAREFAIQDREYGQPEEEEEDWPEEGGEASAGSLQSQAERDLYEALQRNKKAGGA